MRPYSWLLLSVLCIAVPCSSGRYSQLSSPGYPAPYLSNQTRSWMIYVPNGRIKLQFTHFDVGEEEEYCKDYVKVIDSGRPLVTACGQLRSAEGDIPEPFEFLSSSNTLILKFASQEAAQRKHYHGFFAIYTELAFDECAHSKMPCEHYCHSHPKGYFCSCAHGYNLGSDNKSCEKKDLLCTSEIPSNAKQYPKESVYKAGQKVIVKCLEGHEAVMPDNTGKYSYNATCQTDGKWSQYHHCQLIDCGPPDGIDNGHFEYLSGIDVTTYGAIIKYSCTATYYELKSPGDGVYRCSSDGYWKSIEGQTVGPECIAVCGFTSVPVDDEARVMGGSNALPGQFPWQVYFESPRGGGALISDQWVITAAHVMEKWDSTFSGAGLTNLDKKGLATHLTVEKVFYHPDFKRQIGTQPRTDFHHDIALVKLKENVKMNQLVSPICLPGVHASYEMPENMIGYISGWGITEGRIAPRDLIKAPIPVVNMQKCKEMKQQGKTFNETKFSENMICAGGNKKDSCSGDSGGAFVFHDPFAGNNSRYYVGGIVSWGTGRCNQYGLYIKMSSYLQWIKETMKA